MADAEAAPPSFLQRVQAGDQHALWKLGIRAFILVFDIIGIGCIGWLLSSLISPSGVGSIYYDTGAFLVWGLIPLGLSFIWSTIVLLVQILSKAKNPVHPGIIVGLDLVLWLAFVITALFAIGAAINEGYYSPENIVYDSSYSYSNGWYGKWHLNKNNTWVFEYKCDQSYGYSCNPSSKPTRHCGPQFASCTQEDAFVNKLWHERTTRGGTEYVVAVVEWLNVLLHFTLFVWACVDTHRLNRRTKENKTQDVAEKILKDMQEKGLITIHAQAVHGSGEAREQARPLMSSSRDTTDPDEIREIGRAR